MDFLFVIGGTFMRRDFVSMRYLFIVIGVRLIA